MKTVQLSCRLIEALGSDGKFRRLTTNSPFAQQLYTLWEGKDVVAERPSATLSSEHAYSRRKIENEFGRAPDVTEERRKGINDAYETHRKAQTQPAKTPHEKHNEGPQKGDTDTAWHRAWQRHSNGTNTVRNGKVAKSGPALHDDKTDTGGAQRGTTAPAGPRERRGNDRTWISIETKMSTAQCPLTGRAVQSPLT